MENPVVKTSVSVSFILKEPKIHLNKAKPQNETPILFRVSAGRKIGNRFSTGYKINPKYWDFVNSRVRNVADVTNSLEINNYLNSLKNNFNKIVADKIASGEAITKDTIKEIYHSISNKVQIKQEDDEMTFFRYCNEFIESKKRTLKKESKRGKSTTVSVYEQAIKHLKEFQNETGFKVSFESIDLDFYYDFVEYMQRKEMKDGSLYSLNTIGKHIRSLKTILNAATYEGYNSNLKYKHPEFKITEELTTEVYLDNDELLKMCYLDLSEYPIHEKARDIFILGCETGQRISDYNNFFNCEVVSHKEGDYIAVKQKKTGNKVFCFITPMMKKIMKERYEGKPPTFMNEQYINAKIKEVARMAGIKDLIKVEQTKGGRKIIEEIQKCKLISTHTARRSYSTIKYKAGVPVHDIMQLTGHKSEREFLKYIREDGRDKAARVTDTNAFKESYLKVV